MYNILKDYKYKIFDIHQKEINSKEQYAWLLDHQLQARVVCKGE